MFFAGGGLSQLTLCTLQAAETTTHHQQLLASAVLLRLQKVSLRPLQALAVENEDLMQCTNIF